MIHYTPRPLWVPVPTELESLFALREEGQFLNSKLGSRIHNVGTINKWRVQSREFGGVPGSSSSLSINSYEMALSRPRFGAGEPKESMKNRPWVSKEQIQGKDSPLGEDK